MSHPSHSCLLSPLLLAGLSFAVLVLVLVLMLLLLPPRMALVEWEGLGTVALDDVG